MEAAPRLPMLSFDLKVCTENTQFAPQLKQYIATFYNEDPDSYLTEIHNLESLRAVAVRPSMDVNGVQLLKKYYCQLHFLKSRFPMEENQDAAVQFLWKDNQAGMNCGGSDIRFELMVIMYNIGALHSYLGATDSRSNPDGMKMACTHFQCAAWAFQASNDELVGSKTYKEWTKYLQFKVAYHKCIALLFQGQQAEEQQKMGERVAFYQAACDQLEEARKLSTCLKNRQQEINESLAFTLDVVEGKRKAAKNENEFIYHEEVPDLDHLQEVSGPDIFARLVPMEAHEAASLYSEKKAQVLRQIGELVENKDHSLAEFMSSMQLDLLTKMNQATGIPQELIDRAAALSAKPTATQDLVEAMGKLSNIYQDVESNLNEIDILLKEEEEAEKHYQELMGKRPPSIIATDLAREAAKYREAHTKANDSNQTLHRAMTAHIANLKILQQPLRQLQQQLPSVELPNPNIDEKSLKDLETLVAKVEEMRTQRGMLWAQFRESVHKDDITNSLVTKQPNQSLEQLFQQELQKHQQLAGLIEQNCAAQENIRKALVDCYAQAVNTRRYVQDVIQKRTSTISALISSHDTYDDLLAKANKGIEFYTKLDTNVSKLLQRIKSACKVQQEEREQILSKNDIPKQNESSMLAAPASTTPKLKDYLESRKKNPAIPTYPDPNLQYHQTINYGLNVSQNMPDTQTWPPAIRPTPLGSEVTDLPKSSGYEAYSYPSSNIHYAYGQVQPATNISNPYQSIDGCSNQQPSHNVDPEIINRMNSLLSNIKNDSRTSQPNAQYSYSNYIPQNYASATYSYSTQPYTHITQSESNNYDPNKAYTTTTNSYRPLSSYTVPNSTNTHMQYSESSLGIPTTSSDSDSSKSNAYQYPGYAQQNQNSQPTQISTPNSYSQTNINAYYPAGYGPHYSTPGMGEMQSDSTTGQTQYHSLEYATSVQPNQINYSYNSTYSSPVAHMSSAHARDANYMATSAASAAALASQAQSSGYSVTAVQSYANAMGNQQAYTNTNTSSLQQSDPNTVYSSGAGSANQQAYAADSVQSGSYPTSSTLGASDSQHSYSSPQPYQFANSTSYQTGPSHQQSYQNLQSHQGNTNASYPADASTAQIGSTDSQQSYTHIAQFYPPGTGPYQSYPSGAGTPDTQQTYQTFGSSSVTDQNAGYAAYANYYGQGYGQNYPTNYNYGPSANVQHPTHQENTVNIPMTTKESNVDLLSGLDFTISQAPLIPQQKVLPKSEESDVKPASSESKVSLTKKASMVKEEKALPEIKRLNVKILPSKPLNNNDVKNLFNQEVEKYEKYVETLTNKTLSGPTNLDIKWKEIQDKQDCEGQKKIISVARCYPRKNRFPDILPYDYSRVELHDAKDDYINASYDVSPYAPPFIVAQSPLSSTFGDFWTMIREQQVELIFCVSNDQEIGNDVYWPKEKGQHLNIQNMVISLQSVIVKSHWIERLISVNLPEKRDSWIVMHLQFTSWPGSYVLELITLYQQQRCATHPIVVHCSSGIGKTGLVCLLTAAIFDVTNNANSIPDLASLCTKLTNCRKNILRDREHLKFAYEAFLSYMKQVVSQEKMKKKLNEVVPKLQEENKQSVEIVEKSSDPLSTLDPFWASKK
ncbi:hypothetical protein NQ314_009620 [Rhamnusium bicolor]|uniref:Tyrosine-protein phosphatase non-receptor type 23 n=1 Tax=Rhamnusium bicolor TaxID=1586634 RepID=A0AAV8XZE2_9CUCU|nr:hypothetical protein NQ314_009620 [Rhamnusium bicolor]